MEYPSKTKVQSPKNLLELDPSEELLKEYSNDLKVTKDTPRVIIFLSNNDLYETISYNSTRYILLSSFLILFKEFIIQIILWQMKYLIFF